MSEGMTVELKKLATQQPSFICPNAKQGLSRQCSTLFELRTYQLFPHIKAFPHFQVTIPEQFERTHSKFAINRFSTVLDTPQIRDIEFISPAAHARLCRRPSVTNLSRFDRYARRC
jgi:hypothetical protein